MPMIKILSEASGQGVLALFLCISAAASAGTPLQSPSPEVANSSVRLQFDLRDASPRLAWLHGSAGYNLANRAEETLPAAVEVNGTSVPVIWQYKPDLNVVGDRHAVFVYESANPHLRLRWEWQARANFGPIEHRITIENLSGQEVWLPMVDSLRLDWKIPIDAELRNFYVEKGAGSPSAQGTHSESMADGYDWTGTSSTYAHPADNQPREIIPAEFVYSPRKSQAGWYAGMEFSGRTRIHLERGADGVQSVLGLNPDPGPFRTRLVPGGSFESPTVFLGAFDDGPDGAGNQLRPWVRAVLGNPLTWKNPHYPLVVNNSWGSGMGSMSHWRCG